MNTPNNQNKKLDEITYIINGCAMKIHRTLGNGFQEVIYQRCMEIELKKSGCGGVESGYSFRRCSFSASKKLFGSL